MQACTRLLALAPSPEHSRILMTGFLEAYQGRSIDGLPEELKAAIAEYRESLGKSDLVLGVRLGDAAAIDKALAAIRDEKRDPASRLVLIETFGQISIPKSVSVLVSLLRSPNVAVRKGALQSLMRYSNPDIARRICDAYHSTLTDEAGQREAALQALASRPNWTAQFLSEIEQFRIPVTSVPADVIQQMRLHTDPEIQARIDKLWGHTRATNEQKLQEIERLRKVIAAPLPAGLSLQQAREAGGQLFKQHCATCHTLFSQGGQTGPNLTGYERTNLGFLLLAIVDPSAGIREEFTQFQIVTVDGRILTGLVTDQSPNTVTLRGANNQLQVIARDQIDILQAMPTSLMPEGLMQKLSDQQTVELFAYLMQPTP
jgi:putative heme-binding domain-containing protein